MCSVSVPVLSSPNQTLHNFHHVLSSSSPPPPASASSSSSSSSSSLRSLPHQVAFSWVAGPPGFRPVLPKLIGSGAPPNWLLVSGTSRPADFSGGPWFLPPRIQDPPEITTESDELGCIKARVWSRNVCFALFRADFTPWTWLQGHASAWSVTKAHSQ